MALVRPTARRAFLLLALGATAAFSGVLLAPVIARACGSETYSAKGVVRSFGPGRAYVNIAHEKIEGYMAAMTMSFEPRTSDQIAALKEGDRVSFAFTATEDGRRLINSLKKE
jgi:Cu/Ag efflux protein CusF